MDVLKPQSKEKMPAIVYVTGGGFINANKDSYMQHAWIWQSKGMW